MHRYTPHCRNCPAPLLTATWNRMEQCELIPLPFERDGPAHLHLELSDDSTIDISGNHSQIHLEGEKVFLDDYI